MKEQDKAVQEVADRIFDAENEKALQKKKEELIGAQKWADNRYRWYRGHIWYDEKVVGEWRDPEGAPSGCDITEREECHSFGYDEAKWEYEAAKDNLRRDKKYIDLLTACKKLREEFLRVIENGVSLEIARTNALAKLEMLENIYRGK